MWPVNESRPPSPIRQTDHLSDPMAVPGTASLPDQRVTPSSARVSSDGDALADSASLVAQEVLRETAAIPLSRKTARVRALERFDMPFGISGYGALKAPPMPGDFDPFPRWGLDYRLSDARNRGVDLLVKPLNQGYALDPESGTAGTAQQSCGTTSLLMIMHHFGMRPPTPEAQMEIDRDIRRSNSFSFTNPMDIVDYANRNGFRAQMQNHSSLDDLVSLVDQGVPVQVLMEPLWSKNRMGPDPSDDGIHYVVVNGYERDASGKVSDVIMSDPWGLHYRMPVDEFQRRWANLQFKDKPTGLHHFMIAMVPETGSVRRPDGASTPGGDVRFPGVASRNDPVWWSVGIAGVAMDFRNAVARPTGFVDRLGLAISAMFKLLGLGVAGGLRAIGLGSWSEPFLQGIYAAIRGARAAASAVGNAVGAMGHAVSEAGKGIGHAAGQVLGAVGNWFKLG